MAQIVCPMLLTRVPRSGLLSAELHDPPNPLRSGQSEPYRAAVSQKIEAMLKEGPPPAVVSLHTFTPVWRGRVRPWETGILWDSDPRFAKPLVEAMRKHGLRAGDNEPYDGALAGDTLNEEVTRRGLAGLLIETRNDLVNTETAANAWAGRIATILHPVLARPEIHEIEFYPSRAGRRGWLR